MSTAHLPTLVQELRSLHQCHTIILYGSYARGDHTPQSDIDILCVTADGEATTDSRLWQDRWLDAWIYPETACAELKDFLHIADGTVLWEQDDWGSRFIEQVQAVFAQGPAPLPDLERQHRLAWFDKMLARITQDDLEARFRQHWLLVELLHNYFAFRDLWYLGPKRSFQWLHTHDPENYARFEILYSPTCTLQDIQTLVPQILQMGCR